MPDEIEKALDLVSKAWGRGARGYCFFPTLSGSKDIRTRRERLATFQEGRAFRWPDERPEVLAHLRRHADDDVYWTPVLFDAPRRVWENAKHERCLWADLDETDPRTIDDYPPTIAWETSPGRYQALWLLAKGYIQGASWPGNENQRLTYHVDADTGGWDTTQLLRLPGWTNHKPEHLKDGEFPKGQLLWADGRKYFVDDFEALPEVPHTGAEGLEDAMEEEVRAVDRHEVWGRVRLKVTQRARDIYSARAVAGDRSEQLWYLMRCLADAGCTVAEIVAVAKETVWNKFDGREDEMRRLVAEAAKAISKRDPEVEEKLEEERGERPEPVMLMDLVRDIPAPRWLVRGVLTRGACGFIAGQPKSYKSWVALDLAISVAEGMRFLDHFPVVEPGPVLYVQEEDSLPLLKARVEKIWAGKQGWKLDLAEDGLYAVPPHETTNNPQVWAVAGSGLVVSDPSWQSWLDEKIAQRPYVMVVMDPLMMMAGDVRDDKAQEMTEKIFKPLKLLARKHGVALVMVHHMRKTSEVSERRGGQLMLGSVANHAWAEDSLYVGLGRKGSLQVEVESKTAPVRGFRVHQVRSPGWSPIVEPDDEGNGQEARSETRGDSGSSAAAPPLRPRLLEALKGGPRTLPQLAADLKVEDKGKLRRTLRALEQDGLVASKATGRRLYGKEIREWMLS